MCQNCQDSDGFTTRRESTSSGCSHCQPVWRAGRQQHVSQLWPFIILLPSYPAGRFCVLLVGFLPLNFRSELRRTEFRLNASAPSFIASCFLHQQLSRIQNHNAPLFINDHWQLCLMTSQIYLLLQTYCINSCITASLLTLASLLWSTLHVCQPHCMLQHSCWLDFSLCMCFSFDYIIIFAWPSLKVRACLSSLNPTFFTGNRNKHRMRPVLYHWFCH